MLAKLYISLIYKIKIVGMEHVPKNGAVIVATNHISNHDPIILISILDRKIHFLAKQDLFRFGLSRWFFEKLSAIPVERKGGKVIRPVRRSIAVIHQGDVFGIFPEGKRCKHGEFVQPKKGVAFFGYRTGAPVLPITIVRMKKQFRRPVKVLIGPLIDVTTLHTTDYSVLSQYIMEQIREVKNRHED
jgi:1-acyl-sn-glycerol-3-phosphate acyltransferase